MGHGATCVPIRRDRDRRRAVGVKGQTGQEVGLIVADRFAGRSGGNQGALLRCRDFVVTKDRLRSSGGKRVTPFGQPPGRRLGVSQDY